MKLFFTVPLNEEDQLNGHHVWCNGDFNTDPKTCKWCSGSNGLHAKYPEDCSPDELVKKHFPNVIKR